MIKRLLVFVLCIALLIACVPAVYAAEPTVSMTFDKDAVTIGDSVTATLNVDDDITHFSARIETNGKVSYLSGAEFDYENSCYYVSFDPGEESVDIEFFANYKGDGYIYLSNIEYTSLSGTSTMKTLAFEIRVRPEYIPIYTKEDLNNIRNNLSGNFILMNDIIFSETDFAEGGDFYNGGNGWIPIGAMPSCAFSGSFYGNGYTISGLKINRAYYFYNGLFGVLSGEVEALRLKDTVIDVTQGINTTVLLEPAEEQTETPAARAGVNYEDPNVWTDPNATADESTLNKYDRSGEANALAGFVCGINNGTVRECYVQGTAVGNRYLGGIAARNSGTVKNSAVNIEISGATLAGGIAADATVYSKVYDCVIQGNIEAVSKGSFFGTAKGAISRSYSICGINKVCASGEATLTEVYFADISNAKEITFTKGDWNYEKLMPYPTHIFDIVKAYPTVFGDVDKNGNCDTGDLAVLKLYLVGTEREEEICPNVDLKGIANSTDLAILKLYLAGVQI